MKTYDFTLVFEMTEPGLTEEALESLCAAGVDDALIGESAGVLYADFSRSADDILEAVVSGIEDVESAGVGARVVRVEPDDLVSIADIARRTGRTDESVRLLIRGERGPGAFPAPATRVGGGRSRVWRWADVEEWLGRHVAQAEVASEMAHQDRYWSVIALVNEHLRQRAYWGREDDEAVQVRNMLRRRLADRASRGRHETRLAGL